VGLSQPDQSGANWAPTTSSLDVSSAAWAGRGVGALRQVQVRAAIARAAKASGVDFTYLLAQARMESSLNPNARAATSSATGLFQFTNGTWLTTMRRHGAELGTLLAGAMPGTPGFSMPGLGAAGGLPSPAVQSADGALAALATPAGRAQLLALRTNPQVAAFMAAKLADDNRAALTTRLGREPDHCELYMAHFLGVDGASRFLNGLAANPTQSAAALLPRAAAANRAVFFDGAGMARSLGQVMDMMRGRMAVALQADGTQMAQAGRAKEAWSPEMGLTPAFDGVDAGLSEGVGEEAPAADELANLGPIARQFVAAAGQNPAAGGVVALPSAGLSRATMAQTLRESFDSIAQATGISTPDSVRAAYARLGAMGL
jgi:hypothetical protein